MQVLRLRLVGSLMLFWASSLIFHDSMQACAPPGRRRAQESCLSNAAGVPLDLQTVSQDASMAEEHYKQGLQFESAGDFGAAEEQFKAALAKDPAEGEFFRGLALFYIRKAHYDRASRVIADYVNLCGATSTGYELEAELLFQQKQYDAAYNAILRSLTFSDNNGRMHQLLGLVYVVKHQDLNALPELRRASELNPDDAQTRYFYGRVLYSLGRHSEARDQFLACLRINPGYRNAFENLGLCYQSLEDYGEATRSFLKAIDLEKQRGGPSAQSLTTITGPCSLRWANLTKQ